MEQLIPRTLKRLESYQTNLYKSAVLSKFQNMTRGHLTLRIQGEAAPFSFGFGQKVRAAMDVKNERFFMRFLRQGELGFGESYVDGDWDSPDLVSLIRWFLLNMDQLDALATHEQNDQALFQFLQGIEQIQSLINKARPEGFADAIASHYELERPFFALMLDPSLSNSGALFEEGDSLEQAQHRKQRRIAQELQIQPGDHVLELGSGWGSLSLYLALCYPCRVTALTISEEQFQFLNRRVRELGLEDRVFPQLLDYRSLRGSFDRIVSVELIDALESTELAAFFTQCDQLLKPHGIMVHQFLLCPERFRSEAHAGGAWIRKYISPGASTPSLAQVIKAMNERASFCVRRFEDIGLSYVKTLEAWRKSFEEHLPEVQALGFDATFIRSWRYYLAYAEAAFAHGLLTAAQITMTRPTQRAFEDGQQQAKSFQKSVD